MTRPVRFANATMVIPEGWFDVTDDLPKGSPPTLAKSDGIGALQFSTATYEGGPAPEISGRDLRAMLDEFGENNGLGAPESITDGKGRSLFVGGRFEAENEVVHAWYVSNGKDVVLVTYVAQDPENPKLTDEIQDASSIVASLEI